MARRRGTAEQRSGIETVAMDMWEAYRNSTLRHVPGAAQKIVYDNFHVAKHMNRAVDEVWRSENVYLQGKEDETLKETRQLWHYGMENVPRKWASCFKTLRASVTPARIKEAFDNYLKVGRSLPDQAAYVALAAALSKGNKE